MKRLGISGMATSTLFCLLFSSNLTAQKIGVNVNQEGQPASGVTIIFLAANTIKTQAQPTENADNSTLNLSNVIKPPTAVTDSSGVSVLDLSNILKPHEQGQVQIVVRKCEDGKTVVYLVQQGAEIPPQDEKCVNNDKCKCKDRPAGFFLIGDGDTVNVGINPGSIDVQVTHPAVAPEKSTTSGNTPVKAQAVTNSFKTIWFVAEGGVGQSWNPSAGCAGLTQTLNKEGFDQVACGTNARDTAYVIDGQVRFLRYFGVSGGFLDDGSVTQKTKATVSSAPGVVGTVNGFFGPVRGWTFQGLASLPFTDNFALILRGGLQSWGVNSGNASNLVVPGFPTTHDFTSQKNSGVNPLIGATFEYWVTHFFAFDASYAYARYTDGSSVNEKDHKLLFGIMVGLRRPGHLALFQKH
jgi:hypothetical protein